MFHNVGKIDRIIRIALALLFGVLYFTKVIEGTFATVLIIAAGILLLTSIRKCCPLYMLFGFGTCQMTTKKSKKTIETKEINLSSKS